MSIRQGIAGLAAGLALVAIGALAAADPSIADRKRANTTVTISSKFPAFHGRVKSPTRPCERKRRVHLYKKRAGRPDRRLGRDRSRRNGRWAVRVSMVRSGAYYAKAKPRPGRRGRGCKADRSKVVVVS